MAAFGGSAGRAGSLGNVPSARVGGRGSSGPVLSKRRDDKLFMVQALSLAHQ